MENEDALISIILPCYNSSAFLNDAIGSILTQTYTNWECIIIDDHSQDNSMEVAERYRKRFPGQIKCYTNIGKGACEARNYGLELSKGDYVKFLDSDDRLFDDNVLESQISFLINENCDIVYGNEYYYKDSFEESNLIKKRGEAISKATPGTFYRYFPITSNFFIKRSSLECLKWNINLKSGQEFFLLFQCYFKGLTFAYHPIPICKIRIHGSVYRISNKAKADYAVQVHELYEHLFNEIGKYNVTRNELIEFKKQVLVRSYHAIKAKNFKALRLMQATFRKIKSARPYSLKVNTVFLTNSISPFLGYSVYKMLTLKGGKF